MIAAPFLVSACDLADTAGIGVQPDTSKPGVIEGVEGRRVMGIRVPGPYLWDIDYSPDGESIIAVGGDTAAHGYNAFTGLHEFSLEQGDDGRRVVYASNDHVLLGGFDGVVRMMEIETGDVIFATAGLNPDDPQLDIVEGLAISEDGSHIAVSRRGGVLQLLDSDGVEIDATAISPSPVNVAFRPTHTELALVSYHSQEVETLQLANLVGVQGFTHPSRPNDAAFSPTGDLLVTTSEDAVVRFWDIDSGTVAGELAGHSDRVFDVEFSPDGRLLATAGFEDNTVILWDVETREPLFELEHPNGVIRLSFNPDGTRLATATLRGVLRVWNVEP